MKKVLLLLFVIAAIASIVIWQKYQPPTSDVSVAKEVSGAYEALNFLGARQTYPYATLPTHAYQAAWERWQLSNPASERGTPPVTWETLGPHNRGGRTLVIQLNPQNPNTLYAGSASGGLWRSYTAGVGVQAWQQVEIDFPVLGVSTIAIHPTDSLTMYIGTGEVYNYEAAGTGAAYRNTRGSYGMGILKTTDGGQTWTKSLDWSYNQQHGIWMVKFDPTNPDRLYAATTEGIYKSTDAGASWTQVLDVVMGTDLLIHPENPDVVVAACGNFGSPGFGIYRTEDGGDNWQQITSGLPTNFLGKIQLGAAPSDPDIIYASIGNGFGFDDGASWLCRSTNFGASWTIRSTEDYSRFQGWFAHDVAVKPDDPNEVIAIGINVWRSENAGSNLTILTTGGVGFSNPPIEGPDGDEFYVHSDAHDVIYHPTEPNKVFVASDGGIHRSDNGGDTWYSANGGYQTVQFYNGVSTSQNSDDFYVGGLQDNGTIRWNGDLTWRRVNGGDGSWTAISPLDDDVYFVSSQRLNVRRTVNGGDSFSSVDWGDSYLSPTAFIAPYVIAPSNGQILYAGTLNMAKSTDTGTSWTAINGGNPLDGNPILSIEVAPQNENVVYAGTAPYEGQRGHVFVTQDGNTFTDVTADLPDRFPMDITVDPTDPAVAYVVFSGFGTGHVYKTENFGNSWEDITDNLPDVPTNAVIVDPLYPDNVYVGNDLGVFLSTSGGTNWEEYGTVQGSAAMIFDLKISPSNRKLRAATHGNGAYQSDLLEGSVNVDDIAANHFQLTVFPNPIVGTATIEFEWKDQQPLQLSVLSANGRTLETTELATTGGELQTITKDFSRLPTGVYFLKLTNGTQQQVQRVVIE